MVIKLNADLRFFKLIFYIYLRLWVINLYNIVLSLLPRRVQATRSNSSDRLKLGLTLGPSYRVTSFTTPFYVFANATTINNISLHSLLKKGNSVNFLKWL